MTNKKIALVTGATGMDGSHLIELLLEKDYKVYAMIRRSSTENTWRLHKVLNNIEFVISDLTDQASLYRIISSIKPSEIYNCAAQSFVRASWENPESTIDINALGVMRLLEAVHSFGHKGIKVFQASSSEQFGKVQQTPQDENTPFYPRSPYGISKVAGFWIAKNYRESYGMFVANAISFNHTSHRRGLEFVERKISYNVAKIKLGLSNTIEMGNLEPKRDWSWAPEFCEMFWKMLQLDIPDDFVLASGETHSVREFLIEAFKCVGIKDWEKYYFPNHKFMRPAEVDALLGNSAKAKKMLGFTPKIGFKEIVKIMVDSDIERLQRGDRFL